MSKNKLSNPSDLSPRQLELLECVTRISHEEHRMPTLRELAKMLKVSAVGTIQDHVRALLEKGYLKREGRTLRLNEKRSAPMVSIPIVGEVAAGSMQDAFEVSLGTLAINPELLGEKSNGLERLLALRVRGESMVDAGILPGDLVVLKRQSRCKTGDIVVALMHGEATVKELRIPKGSVDQIELVPHNKNMKSIKISTQAEGFEILGKVISVQRYFS